jgi:hypothetical protein
MKHVSYRNFIYLNCNIPLKFQQEIMKNKLCEKLKEGEERHGGKEGRDS